MRQWPGCLDLFQFNGNGLSLKSSYDNGKPAFPILLSQDQRIGATLRLAVLHTDNFKPDFFHFLPVVSLVQTYMNFLKVANPVKKNWSIEK